MRTFNLESTAGRRQVVIQVRGQSVAMIERKPDGSTSRNNRELNSESEARALSEKMAKALIAKGFTEQPAPSPAERRPAKVAVAARPADPDDMDLSGGDDGDPVEQSEPVLSRLSATAGRDSAEEAPKKKKRKKKRKTTATTSDGLDKRVIAGCGVAGALFVLFLLYNAYDVFLKPASIVGNWRGSRIEFEISKSLTHDQYALILDADKQFSLSIGGGEPMVGTYSVQGKTLKLRSKLMAVVDDAPAAAEEEKNEPAAAAGRVVDGFEELEYKIELSQATLDLYDMSSGKKVVQLIRMTKKDSAGKTGNAPAAPKAPSSTDAPADPNADQVLASVEKVAKDAAFKLRHPTGWTAETGGRADNSYSWIKLTKGNAKIKVTADALGSLMSGSDSDQGNHAEGSESAPVHRAHVLAKKAIADEYSGYAESEPATFKGSRMGEGRVATYTASDGMFGSKITGYRITLLTGDRRVTILAECPSSEFAKAKETFLAVGRSLSR